MEMLPLQDSELKPSSLQKTEQGLREQAEELLDKIEVYNVIEENNPEVNKLRELALQEVIAHPYYGSDVVVVGESGVDKSTLIGGTAIKLLSEIDNLEIEYYSTGTGLRELFNRGLARLEDLGKYHPLVFFAAYQLHAKKLQQRKMEQLYYPRRILRLHERIAGDGLIRDLGLYNPIVLFSLTNDVIQGKAADLRDAFKQVDPKEAKGILRRHRMKLDYQIETREDLMRLQARQGNRQAILLTRDLVNRGIISAIQASEITPPSAALEILRPMDLEKPANSDSRCLLQKNYYIYLARQMRISQGRFTTVTNDEYVPGKKHIHTEFLEQFGVPLNDIKLDPWLEQELKYILEAGITYDFTTP